jgi:hypothetical protein
MNISELSANQLRHAASIKDEIAKLHAELTSILGAHSSAPATLDGRKQKRTVSAATRAKMAAAQQQRWAANQSAAVGAKPTPKKKFTMSASAKAAISKAAKARWAKIKAAKKP